jgi:hypothetical protein
LQFGFPQINSLNLPISIIYLTITDLLMNKFQQPAEHKAFRVPATKKPSILSENVTPHESDYLIIQ